MDIEDPLNSRANVNLRIRRQYFACLRVEGVLGALGTC